MTCHPSKISQRGAEPVVIRPLHRQLLAVLEHDVVLAAEGGVERGDAARVQVLWTSQRLGDFSSPPTVADDTLYISGEDKHIYAINAATGATLWSFLEDDWGIGAPLLSAGTLYFARKRERCTRSMRRHARRNGASLPAGTFTRTSRYPTD